MPTTSTSARGRTRLQDLAIDRDGFLIDPTQWNEEVAKAIAAVDGVGPLTPDHWGIVHYMREHHFTYGSLPPAAQVCHSRGLDKHAVTRLFGSCRGAWRLAGLPNPGDEALSYMN